MKKKKEIEKRNKIHWESRIKRRDAYNAYSISDVFR